MSDFSTLPKLVLMIVRLMCLAISGLLALIIGLLLWVRHTDGAFQFQQGDKATIMLMAVLIVVALFLVRIIGKEILRTGRN